MNGCMGHSSLRSVRCCLSMFVHVSSVLVRGLHSVVFPVVARRHGQGTENACMNDRLLLTVWLAPCSYNMLQHVEEWFPHLQFCSRASSWRDERRQFRSRRIRRFVHVCSIFQAQGQSKSCLSGRFLVPCTESIDSISWVEGFRYHSIQRVKLKYIYIILHSRGLANQNRSKLHMLGFRHTIRSNARAVET